MTRLLLVRHGETAWNQARRYQGWSDQPLSDRGQEQARRLARRLQPIAVDAFYASDLQRAWQTANLIGDALPLSPAPEPHLREMNFGVIEGLTFAEAQARYPQMMSAWLADDNHPPRGGETAKAFARRLSALLDALREKHAQETVLLVTHGGPIRELLRLGLDLPHAARWLFRIEVGSLSELALHKEQGTLNYSNDTSHLNKENT